MTRARREAQLLDGFSAARSAAGPRGARARPMQRTSREGGRAGTAATGRAASGVRSG
jgi:hypothetical protein